MESAATAPLRSQTRRWEPGPVHRLSALLTSLGCGTILGIAAWLNPAPGGHGTHMQLGLPSCAWASALNHPCPTCGMTTAFSYAAHGRFISAFLAQPFGFVLALVTAAGFWAGLHIAATGSPVGRIYVKLLAPRVLWIATGLALLSWAYKWITWQG